MTYAFSISEFTNIYIEILLWKQLFEIDKLRPDITTFIAKAIARPKVMLAIKIEL